MLIYLTILCHSCGTLMFPGQPDIKIDVYGPQDPELNLVFFAPHQNEHVINGYLKRISKRKGFRFLVLDQSGDRHLYLRFPGSDPIEVDPNRIFTQIGRESTLRRLNPQLDQGDPVYRQALNRTQEIAAFIVQAMALTSDSTIIAIHNNTDGYDDDGKHGKGTISIRRYAGKHRDGAAYILDVHEGSGDEDDLFFITEMTDFKAMKADDWHVIIQHPQVANLADEDDGSLSVYAAKQGLRYINIEAQRDPDHYRVQKRMVKYVLDLAP